MAPELRLATSGATAEGLRLREEELAAEPEVVAELGRSLKRSEEDQMKAGSREGELEGQVGDLKAQLGRLLSRRLMLSRLQGEWLTHRLLSCRHSWRRPVHLESSNAQSWLGYRRSWLQHSAS